jgi:hypothetical protein
MTDHTTEAANIAETMRETVEELGQPVAMIWPEEGFSFDSPVIFSTPAHRRTEDLTAKVREAAEYLKPARRLGNAKLATLDSLVDWTNRFKGDTSALYANPDENAPTLTCVADYHGEGAASFDAHTGDPLARHCSHRGTYAFPVSKEWKKWAAISGIKQDKNAMGQFIEDNAKDILNPSTALISGKTDSAEPWEIALLETAAKIEGRFGSLSQLLQMSRSFQVHETSNLSVTTNRDTGESSIQFLNEHKDPEGNPLRIPNLFLIAIPVFESGHAYRLPVRFQYRKDGGQVWFILSVYDPQAAFDDAFDEAVKDAKERTGLPLFLGTPET